MGARASRTNDQLEQLEGEVPWEQEQYSRLGAASLVAPQLFLGSLYDARNAELLEQLGVTHVLNVAAEAPNYRHQPQLVYQTVVVGDMITWEETEIREGGLQAVEECHRFINEGMSSGNVLVHCMRGRSRSCLVVVTWLMRHQGMSLAEAHRHVALQRDAVGPHHQLKLALIRFETDVQGNPPSYSLQDFVETKQEQNKRLDKRIQK